MNQVEDDLDMMCRVGFACGLMTVSEAYSNIYHHYDAFFKIEEASSRLQALYLHLGQNDFLPETTLEEIKGKEWIEQMIREEKEFFEREKP